MIAAKDRYTFATPGIMGTKPIALVESFEPQEKMVTYSYLGNPTCLQMTLPADRFLTIYPKKLN